MKTFQQFILDCEFVEGYVPWHDPKNPLESGLTPAEKNAAVRARLGINNPDVIPIPHKTSAKSSAERERQNIPSEREFERHGNLQTTNDEQLARTAVPKSRHHSFKKIPGSRLTIGQLRRKKGLIPGQQIARNAEDAIKMGKKTNNEHIRREGEHDRQRYGMYSDLSKLNPRKKGKVAVGTFSLTRFRGG